jgi:sterol desaturase/sphingolipid hydroxylase (fatty acid hydroxylase superfamily)
MGLQPKMGCSDAATQKNPLTLICYSNPNRVGGQSMTFISDVFSRVFAIYANAIPAIIGLAVLFTVLTIWESQTSSPGKVWWKNPGLPTDLTYAFVHSLLVPYLHYPITILVFLGISTAMTPADVIMFFKGKHGLLGGLSFWEQAIIYVLLTDFLHYWIHRGFHNAQLWRFHAIHHSATQVDWTTTYRSHPLNVMLQPVFVGLIMAWLGISPEVVAFFIPFDILSAAFVHANVNWSFGPLKYIIATPVFHRWHHGPEHDGGSSNFAPTFAIWDVLFGTFHMPKGRLPEEFGQDDHTLPEGYLKQLAYPFRKVAPQGATVAAHPATAG